MTIRPATHADVPVIREFARNLVDQHVRLDPARFSTRRDPLADYPAWLDRLLDEPARHCVLIAEDAGQVVGYLIAEHEQECAHLVSPEGLYVHDLYVAAEARGRGVARALIEALFERRPGVPIRLITATGNEPARRLFASLGFRPVAVEMARP